MHKPKFHVKAGDVVEVTSGNHKGASGKVLQIIAKKQQVIIEGVRLLKHHERKSQDRPEGAITEREGPIHVSNVKLIERGTPGKSEKAA